ncbi:MAG: glycosyltransferase [Bacteroidales bacterium]|nr:glycosyltransferase [Bacteroidales bacterium]
MIISFAIVTILYSLLVLAFCYNWRDDDKPVPCIPADDAPLVSVIVAFRNEEKNLPALVESLLAQSYGKQEIILVNDHSDDSSMAVVKSYNDSRINLIDAPDEVVGKKAALRLGYEKSHGEILYFTDADCILKSNCIETLVSRMCFENCAMMCGPVRYSDEKGFFSGIVQLEFLSLTGSGAAGFFMGRPFMCNGANFAVERKVYAEADLNTKYSSGDDVFLLHYADKKYKVGFAQSVDCIVETKAPRNLAEFFSQRVRWASKAGGYKNPFAIFVSAMVFLMAVALLVSFVMGCIQPLYFIVFACLLFMKNAVDMYFIVYVLHFYRCGRLWWATIPLTIVHPLYIVSVAFAALVYKPMWKGRKIKA